MILFLIYILYIILNFNDLNFYIVLGGVILFTICILFLYFYFILSKKININNNIKNFEIIHTIKSFLIYTLFIILCFYLYKIGFINFNGDVGLLIFLQFIIFIIYQDLYFYITHRFLHKSFIYKYSHIQHHKSKFSNIMSIYNLSIIELFINLLGFLPIFIFDLNIYAFILAIFVSDLGNIIGHSGYEFFNKKKMKNNEILNFFLITSYHDLHHSSNKGNFALYFSYLDKIFGTSDIKNKS